MTIGSGWDPKVYVIIIDRHLFGLIELIITLSSRKGDKFSSSK